MDGLLDDTLELDFLLPPFDIKKPQQCPVDVVLLVRSQIVVLWMFVQKVPNLIPSNTLHFRLHEKAGNVTTLED